MKKYQLFGRLREEEYAALEADILKRGVMVPVEIDEEGNILDGHHREEIAKKHGFTYKTITRKFGSEKAKREHVIKLNLARRHLAAYQWGEAFKLLLAEEGVERGKTGPKPASGIPDTMSEIAKAVGVNERTARRRMKQADEYEALPKKKKAEVDSGEKSVRAAVREQNRESVPRRSSPLPSNKFRVIYADPPWKYGDQLTENYGATRFHYPAMSVSDLCALPIKDLAEKDAVLFLWVTSPILPESFAVANAWGFEYKACFVWDKMKHNMGHYCSVQHEFLLLCTRGSCLPDTPKLLRSIVAIKRGRHSEKPEEFRKIIETMYTYGNKVELFAREKHDGWTVWGNET
jgi:N6-adenosine-specific RNA methylase IME4